MIVSASYRTDIPAFYGDWFLARLRAGFCRVVNPYGGAPTEVRLEPGAVDGFVFWTRNAAPFRAALERVALRGEPFVLQYSLTGYARALEGMVPRAEDAIATMRALAAEFGTAALVWRYDPVLITSLSAIGDHRTRFCRLADALGGATDEVVVSIAHVYRKTRRNLDRAAREAGFDWRDPGPAERRELVAALAVEAAARGMRLTVCAQPDVIAGAAEAARCIDAERLSRLAGRPLRARERGNRPGCLCHESRDIGAYDSCPHGCVYCYAVSDRARAARRLKAHDPASAYLIDSR